jgi:prepilin-type N-terminal cleavage/methylation domain-containing protein
MRGDMGRERRDAGFSLIELLVVVGLIVIMAAVAIPRINAYLAVYKVRGAAASVASEMNVARNKAITKNVNHGVVFVVRSPTTYQYVIEDLPSQSGARRSVAAPVAEPTLFGAIQELPIGITFSDDCTGFDGSARDPGFRFNRMGAWCDPGSNVGTCPALPTGTAATPFLVSNTTSGAVVCVKQTSTGLKKKISVGTGGRVVAER